ncbi:zinc finger protein 845-like [Contarinia nasturtii]|uniref:zinc finger protein 845-like n=1 Tax=Contarinia nasturtii TaxID=265458 RepID=UPI0012D44319|nr:zinc finger protein 845-like [Contarinia nasturtii]
MDSINLSAEKHCRACLRQPQSQMHSLSSKSVSIEGTNQTHREIVNLAELYNECTQLVYEEMHPNWEWVCPVCSGKLLEFYKFRQMCIESYGKLKDIESQISSNTEIQIVKVEVVDVANILEPTDDTIPDNDDDFGDEHFDEESFTSFSSNDEMELDTENIQKEEAENIQEEVMKTNSKTFEEDEVLDDSSSDDDLPLSAVVEELHLPKKPNPKRIRKSSTKTSTPVEIIYTCDLCPSKFFKKHRYTAHLRTHQGLKPWKCDHCERDFQKYANLSRHIASKHVDSEAKPIFACDVEGCDKSYTLKQTLNVHIKKVHLGMKLNLTRKICEICGKSFSTISRLLEHSYTHSKISPHKCHICDKMFSKKLRLKEHLMRHEGIKNFVCTVCGQRRITNKELQNHMKLHNPDVQYPCELCSSVFKCKQNLKRHMRVVHLGIKAYLCTHCNQSFGKAETLKHHIMTHTGEKPHCCSICDKRFIQAVALNKHMQTHNKNIDIFLSSIRLSTAMDSINLSAEKHCRACLRQPQSQMHSLSSKSVSIEGTNQTHREIVNLAELYNECTQLVYEEMHPNWEWVCHVCSGKLLEFYKFRQMCIESYGKLKDIESQRSSSTEIQIVKVEVVDVANILEPTDDTIPDNDDDFGDEESFTSFGSNNEMELDTENIQKEEAENIQEVMKTNSKSFEEDEELDDTSSDDDLPLSAVKVENLPIVPKPNKSKKTKKSVKAKKSDSNSNEPIYVCGVCSTKFFKKHRYDAHMRKHQGLKQWKCDHCEKEFEKYSSLKSHITSKHVDSEVKPTFVCDFDGCGKSYSLKESLRVHIKQIHMGRKPNMTEKICEVCGKSFKSNASLIKHTYTHTKVSPYKCDRCSKMFATKYKLKEHVMRHEGIKNYICTICGLRKTTGHELRVHMTHHSSDMQFPCGICSVVFTRMANMKRHMRVVHCGIKAYSCTHCDQSFGKAETLKHHIMTHTGEKPHACSICDKRFIQQIALKTHMKTHNKNK